MQVCLCEISIMADSRLSTNWTILIQCPVFFFLLGLSTVSVSLQKNYVLDLKVCYGFACLNHVTKLTRINSVNCEVSL